MLSDSDFLRLLPKAELHCHFVATVRVETLLELADEFAVPLRTSDMDELLRYRGLPDFLDVFHAAQQVMRTPEAIARVAYEGVEDAVREGNLRYREYFVNPDNFAELGIAYPELIDALVDGLGRAERDFGVGYGLSCAINRSLGPDAAVRMVQTMLAHPHSAVLGIGQDYLTPEFTEDPLRFRDAYALAEAHGLRRSAHVGETMPESPSNVRDAIEVLHVDRIDHGYRAADDPEVVALAASTGVAFTCTPHSTQMLSGWDFDENHRIAQLIRGGVTVTLATDDATLFHTDIGREYTVALTQMGFDIPDAVRIARAGFEAAWCDEAHKQRLLADFDGAVLALTAARA
ncbi:adenosine deaminase [Microbacterium sediminicola]|uniref:Adenosine deaminase n=1 Tax=Microbacterium sediminicola TaxID=415210 RepID=A0ABN2IDB8_9MICO